MKDSKNPPKMSEGIFLPVLLFIMSVYPPLSTDMYMPALTRIAEDFGSTGTTVNLTLVLFFIFFAFSTLLWGPFSDKYGRKKSVLAGILLYTLASLGCALSGSVLSLILFRVLQAIGSGAPVTISLAIVQDVYTGEKKKRLLSLLSALMMVAPVCAPLLGSLVLTFAHWRMTFVILTGLGIISLAGCFRLEETNRNPRKDESMGQAIRGIFRVASNREFSRLLILFSLPALYALGFVGGSSLIYMQGYHSSPQLYSLFFGGNALFTVLGASAYVPLSHKLSNEKLVTRALGMILLSGILIFLFYRLGPLAFTLCLIPGTLASALLRPISFEMLMEKGGKETGVISALINFTFTILGSLGMQIVSFPWKSRAGAYGVMALAMVVICILLWLFLQVTEISGRKAVQEQG